MIGKVFTQTLMMMVRLVSGGGGGGNGSTVVETHAGCGVNGGNIESLCCCVVTDTFLSPHRMPPYNDSDYPDLLENLPDSDLTSFSLDFLSANFMKQQ